MGVKSEYIWLSEKSTLKALMHNNYYCINHNHLEIAAGLRRAQVNRSRSHSLV